MRRMRLQTDTEPEIWRSFHASRAKSVRGCANSLFAAVPARPPIGSNAAVRNRAILVPALLLIPFPFFLPPFFRWRSALRILRPQEAITSSKLPTLLTTMEASRYDVHKIFGFLTPPCPHLDLIYITKFTQPHLQFPLFHDPLPPPKETSYTEAP